MRGGFSQTRLARDTYDAHWAVDNEGANERTVAQHGASVM